MFKEKIKRFGIGDSPILDLIQKNFKIEDDVPSQSRTISEKDYSTIKILVYHMSNDIYVITHMTTSNSIGSSTLIMDM